MGRWLIATLVLLAASSMPPAAGGWQQPPQTFRSGAQVVQVDVRVHKDGRFVDDLTAADFTIEEDGVAQKIDSVVLIRTAAPSAPSAPLAPAPLAPAPSAPLAPSAPSAPPPQLWVFVFDTEHLSPGGLTRTRDAVVKFIADRFRQGDIGGVLADGKMANNRLTSDRDELRRAAEAVKLPGALRSRQLELREWPRLQDEQEAWMIANGDRQALAAAVTRACTDDPDSCRRVPPDVLVQEKARRLSADTRTATLRTLKSAEALTNGLSRMAGAKTIVFVSEGFFLTSHEAELRQTVGMAARAGAHFYSVDARGLNKGAASSDIIDKQYIDYAGGAQQKFDTQEDGTNSLAVDTGGLVIRNENNFGRALDAIQADAATYYVVGYTPSNTTFDGKYRSITITVNRPGTKVRARKGYLALEPAALLRPSAAASAAGPPKPLSEAPQAKAELAPPSLPVSLGQLALPDATVPGASVALVATAANTTPATAVRAHIDGGKMVAALKSAGSEDPAYNNSPADAGWAAYQKGDVVTAATHLAEAARSPDARPWVHYALGLAQFAQSRYKDAATAWERVLRDVPEFEPIYFNLADAYGAADDEGAAIKVLRAAEQRWPADPEVLNAIGVMQIRRGALDAAIDSFDRATTIAPADALGYYNLGRALQMRLLKSQRYDPQMQRWIGGNADRKRATVAFEKYLDIGGPYAAQARDAIAVLAWK